jgi:hypothetical protein
MDGLLTALLYEKRMVHVIGRYDNEWGYASRVADLAQFMSEYGRKRDEPEHMEVVGYEHSRGL